MKDDDRVRVRPEFVGKVGRLERAAEALVKEARRCQIGLIALDELEKAWKDLAIS